MAIIQVRNVKDLNEGSYSGWGSEKHMYNLAKKKCQSVVIVLQQSN